MLTIFSSTASRANSATGASTGRVAKSRETRENLCVGGISDGDLGSNASILADPLAFKDGHGGTPSERPERSSYPSPHRREHASCPMHPPLPSALARGVVRDCVRSVPSNAGQVIRDDTSDSSTTTFMRRSEESGHRVEEKLAQ